MRIGFYFESMKKSGGVYQYALNLLDALKEITGHQYVVFNISPDFPKQDFNLPNWEILDLKSFEKISDSGEYGTAIKESFGRKIKSNVIKIVQYLKLYKLEIILSKQSAKQRAKKFNDKNIDLMFFTGASELSFLSGIPAVVPIHDLEHRRLARFPELRENGQFEKREYVFKGITNNAWRMLAESPIGKQDIVDYYGASPDRITVLRMLAPNYLDPNISSKYVESIRERYKLPRNFYFYPAQIWPHKNHQTLIKSLAILKRQGLVIPLVLVGTRKDEWGEFEKINSLIKDNDLDAQVKFLGYVSNDEMSALYKMAEALVMPTFLGPSNIPVYEAWKMDCPVIYSNSRGLKEQAGDAALLADPNSAEEFAEQMKCLWLNENLRKELIEKGRRRLDLWTWDDFKRTIRGIIYDFEIKLRGGQDKINVN